MAVTSYEIDPSRLGSVVPLRDSSPYRDDRQEQRHDATGTGMPMWTVPALMADLGFEARIRVPSPSAPEFADLTPLRLEGASRVSAFQARGAGGQRGSLTLRCERLVPADDLPDDLFSDAEVGLFLVDPGPLTIVSAERLPRDFRRQDDWTRFTVVRAWQASSSDQSGLEQWKIDVPGRSFPAGVRRMAPATFLGLRAEPYVNPDRTSARLDLVAAQVLPVSAPSVNGRSRREPVTVPAGDEGGEAA